MNYIDVSDHVCFPSSRYDVLQRNGITTARLQGLEQDLGLSGTPNRGAQAILFTVELVRPPVLRGPFGSVRILLSGSNSVEYGACIILPRRLVI